MKKKTTAKVHLGESKLKEIKSGLQKDGKVKIHKVGELRRTKYKANTVIGGTRKKVKKVRITLRPSKFLKE